MTRQAAPVTRPVVLTVAGSDSGGGAGIQADLKTIEACGGFGTSAITNVTAQNTLGVEGTHGVSVEHVRAQIDAVRTDLDVAAAKTGMLGTRAVVETVAEAAPDLPNLVVDPVMVAASGDRLLEPDAEAAYEDLVARAHLVTPNVDEATVLTGRAIEDPSDARVAGEDIVAMGADAALVKGGHLAGGTVVDTLVTGEDVLTFHHDRVETDATHGSGCTLSSAIATRLAHGDDLRNAVGAGIDLLGRAVRYNLDVGEGPGAVHHLVALRDAAARDETAEAVESVVSRFVRRDVGPLVPEVGMNVVGATPYAEATGDAAAVEGRIAKTLDGVRPNRGVRFGASSHVAATLLAAREVEPTLRFAVNCRLEEAVAAALVDLPGAVVSIDPRDRSGRDAVGAIAADLRVAVADEDQPVVAVREAGDDGREPIATLLATDGAALSERTLSLLAAVRD